MNFEKIPGNIDQKEAIRKEIKAELGSFGVPALSEIVERLAILEENSDFDADSRMIAAGVKSFLEIESFGLKVIEKKRVILAARLHDIGKSSSSEDPECTRTVIRLFSKKELDPNQTVSRALQLHFPGEVDEMILNLLKIDVSPRMTMREFWDKHAFWTQEVLDKFPEIFDKETRIIAASHHLDRKINPYQIDTEKITKEMKYSIFLLMAIDKYQAFRARGKKLNHQESMKSLRTILGQYDNDPIMDLVIKTINQLGSTDSLFPKNADVVKTLPVDSR